MLIEWTRFFFNLLLTESMRFLFNHDMPTAGPTPADMAIREYIWDCDSDDGLKCFSFINVLKYKFFILKKLFLISAHQKNLKI